MHFCPDKKCVDPVLKLYNDPIQFVKEAKFLGLIWDTKLTFEPHIKYLKAQCQKSLNILTVLSRTEWVADQTTLLKLYRSLVRSKLDYGCIVYGSASKTALAKLDHVHNQGLRLSLGPFRSSPIERLYVEGHESPLEIRREKLALQYTIKLKASPGNPAYDVVFNPKFYMQTKNQPQIPLDYTVRKQRYILGKLLSIVFLMFPFGILNQLLLILLYPNLTSHLLLLLFLKVDLMR